MIWFTSDEHFGHRNIIKFCKRPFTDLRDMRDQMIGRFNFSVGKDDTTYHLGDMFWRTLDAESAISILRELNGKHYYIRGNHEEVLDNHDSVRFAFHGVYDRLLIEPPNGPRYGIVLDHFAGRVWHHSDKGSWQLYGHSHGELPDDHSLLSMDVGVDAHNWYPQSLDTIRELMGRKIKWMQRRIDSFQPKA